MQKKIQSALISVFHKDGLDVIVKCLDDNGVKIYSTGGTWDYITSLGINAERIEELTTFPSILGGRVKTLHPKVFGGILSIRSEEAHAQDNEKYEIPYIDLVIVDLYPFEKTVLSEAIEEEIIEKIDIGGVSLIRAAAKNFNDVLVVSNREQYSELFSVLQENQCTTSLKTRKRFAREAFGVSSSYDVAIFNWFDNNNCSQLKISKDKAEDLRYGENPNQRAKFFGDLPAMFNKLQGKDLSYNNLLDLDAAMNLLEDFNEITLAVIKHNNACGLASRNSVFNAWKDALAGDTISAFGGVIVSNTLIDIQTAEEINKIFFEIIVAPKYTKDALAVLQTKKNRIILETKEIKLSDTLVRSALNGFLMQDRDVKFETKEDFEFVTNVKPTDVQISDLIFANKIVKHTKSNAIVIAKNNQMLASGIGQTSRVDALLQAIAKAKHFGFDLNGAVMASDAFFPFGDCVEIAHKAGITSIIQPGGSIRDEESVKYCNDNNISMVITGSRHFKH